MEWATGGSFLNGRFVVNVQRPTGSSEIVGPDELGARGLPMPLHTKRRVVVGDFASWNEASTAAYLRAFGLAAANNGHQVFEFQVNGRRFIVPALALMRGLFRPNRHVLAEMFKPQGLEQVCYPVISGNTLSIVPTKSWQIHAWKGMSASVLQPLAWMYSHPSARRMCGSVHEAIMGNRIGLRLPQGTVRMVVHSKEVGDTSYVVSLTIVALDTTERPYDFASAQPTHIDFHDGVRAADGRTHHQCATDKLLLRHPDGSADISDAEWLALQPLLATRCRNKRVKHHPRLLLDGILNKLSSGVSWRNASYKVGSWSNASAFFQELTASGAWAEIQAVIKEIRGRAISGFVAPLSEATSIYSQILLTSSQQSTASE